MAVFDKIIFHEGDIIRTDNAHCTAVNFFEARLFCLQVLCNFVMKMTVRPAVKAMALYCHPQ
jgi:hypothetical protein